MKIINFGSLNLDHVYQVDHFVQPGETLASQSYHGFVGGKGCNQSIALAKAGAKVVHAGKVGADGLILRDSLHDLGVDTNLIEVIAGPSGHAIIQVAPEGENSILLHGGANQSIEPAFIDKVLAYAEPGDILLLQNEINLMPVIMTRAQAQGLTLFLNPAPMTEAVKNYPLELVDHLFINQIEGQQLTGVDTPEQILPKLTKSLPQATIILTLGSSGVMAQRPGQREWLALGAQQVQAIDSTAAGDTFIGYYMAHYVKQQPLQTCLEMAIRAAAVCVTRPGAGDSIPLLSEIN